MFRALSLLLSSMALMPVAQASWSMECALSRQGASPRRAEVTLVNQEGQLKSSFEELALESDASLARGSFLFILQDQAKSQRLAFTGSPLGLDPFGASLQSSTASLECRSRLSGTGLIPTRPEVELPAYLVCMLDEAITENGTVIRQKREIFSVNPAYTFGLQQSIREENDRYSFTVDYLPYNPDGGLTIRLLDKESGEKAGYRGPGQALVSSFILAFTQGDRRTDGKFLRLGCAYTNDPSLFK